MKKYRLLKDLPTFKAGEIFKLKGGNLYYYPAENGTENAHWFDRIMAYHHKTLEKFPNILEELFEEVEEPKKISETDAAFAILRASLDFNSNIITLATAYAGNCTDRRNYERFKKEYQKMIDNYNNTINFIMEGLDEAQE